MAFWQGPQKVFIQKNLFRRLEGPQPILMAVEINAGLNAHRCINISHQGRGHFDMGNPATVTAGDKARYIGKNPASDGDDRLVSAVDGKTIQFAQDPQVILYRLV